MTNSKHTREHHEDQDRPDSQKLKEQKLDQKHLTQLEKEQRRLEKLKEQDEKAAAKKAIRESKAEMNEKMAQGKKYFADRGAEDSADYNARRFCARNMAEISSIGQWQGLGRDVGDFLSGRQHGFDRASTGDMDRAGGGYTDMGRGDAGGGSSR